MNDIPYEVRYTYDGETRYGVVDQYDDEAEEAIARGKWVVSDDILPQRTVLDPNQCTAIDWDDQGKKEWEEASYNEAMKKAEALPDDRLCVGHIFSIGVADGHATYLVTKLTKTRATVEWRGWHNGDRYIDHYFGWGRSCPIKDVWGYVRGEIGMRKIFGSKV